MKKKKKKKTTGVGVSEEDKEEVDRKYIYFSLTPVQSLFFNMISKNSISL